MLYEDTTENMVILWIMTYSTDQKTPVEHC